jgi:hypothetical protein
MGKLFRSDDEFEAVRKHAAQNDYLAIAVLQPRPGEDAREALHRWRINNRSLFRKIAISWRSQRLLERISRSRGPAAFASC